MMPIVQHLHFLKLSFLMVLFGIAVSMKKQMYFMLLMLRLKPKMELKKYKTITKKVIILKTNRKGNQSIPFFYRIIFYKNLNPSEKLVTPVLISPLEESISLRPARYLTSKVSFHISTPTPPIILWLFFSIAIEFKPLFVLISE